MSRRPITKEDIFEVCDRLERENERLRAALQNISQMQLGEAPAATFHTCQKIAREALN